LALEIERKFLVDTELLGPLTGGEEITQGYIAAAEHAAVRVRLADERAWLTVKGATVGASRSEFEYPVPVADARQMLTELCGDRVLSKTRYRQRRGDHEWEIDVFHGANDGLIVAEVELRSETDHPELPDWVGEEVTGDPRYYNANLVSHPFSQWRGQKAAT
jgi:adenylate cyclase